MSTEVRIRDMSLIPISITTEGLLTTAKVEDFGGLSKDETPTHKRNAELVDFLITKNAVFTFLATAEKEENGDTCITSAGEFQLHLEETAGETKTRHFGGRLVDKQGFRKHLTLSVGTQCFILVERGSMLPL